MPQLLSLCSRVWELQLLKPTCARARAPQQKKPPQGGACTRQLESSPGSPQPEKSLHRSKDPAQPKSKLSNNQGIQPSPLDHFRVCVLTSSPECTALCPCRGQDLSLDSANISIEGERLEISSRKLEIPRNISREDGLDKGQKRYGHNRSRRY